MCNSTAALVTFKYFSMQSVAAFVKYIQISNIHYKHGKTCCETNAFRNHLSGMLQFFGKLTQVNGNLTYYQTIGPQDTAHILLPTFAASAFSWYTALNPEARTQAWRWKSDLVLCSASLVVADTQFTIGDR